MSDIKQYQVAKDKDGDLWLITDCDDIDNCLLMAVGFEGHWIACLNPDCEQNDLHLLEILN